MMLAFGISLFIIEGITSAYITLKLIQIVCEDFPGTDGFKLKFYHMLNNGFAAFIVDIFVSMMMNYFTSAGMISGFANLGSSIVVAVLLPPYIEWRYPPAVMLERARLSKVAKKDARIRYKAATMAAKARKAA